MGCKRKLNAMMSSAAQDTRVLPYHSNFEHFREELDIHHDRRERIIKASRDITAASKKIIFALQRVRQIGKPIPDSAVQSNAQHYKTIEKQYRSIAGDVQGLNSLRYAHNLYGHQEYVEALSFQYYLESRSLISYENICDKLIQFGGIILPPEDYILGVYDMTGELMRFAIGTMATTGRMAELQKLDGASGTYESPDSDTAGINDESIRSLLLDLRELRKFLDNFDSAAGSPAFRAEVERKGEVMHASVEKVENALYGLVVRGNEFTASNVNAYGRGLLASEISTR